MSWRVQDGFLSNLSPNQNPQLLRRQVAFVLMHEERRHVRTEDRSVAAERYLDLRNSNYRAGTPRLAEVKDASEPAGYR